ADAGTEPRENSLMRLWDNLRYDKGTSRQYVNVFTQEVLAPIWGLRLDFDERMPAAEIGELLFTCFHQKLRYRSQLELAYNIYLRTDRPRSAIVLLREARNECVFRLPETLNLIRDVAGEAVANRVATSDNRFWRWAWLECLGGLPARDDSFAD